MKISSINSCVSASTQKRVKKTNLNQVQSSRVGRYNVISMSEYLASPLSFKGRNKEQAIFYGAEVAPYSKAGGVGVVMKDYGLLLDSKDEVVVSPYYGAKRDPKTNIVAPLKDGNDYVLKVGKDFKKLDLVAEDTMQWGNKEDNKIMLFRLRDEEARVHYFVFDETTAEFEKPYQAPKASGKFAYASGAKSSTNGWQGDPYAKNAKAFVELLPKLIADKKDFNPATVVCSDSQTAYTHEYLVQKSLVDKDYDEIKSTHVGHNLGPGYCGETSMQNMFVNLGATPKQIEMIENDPVYQQNLLGDNYFRPFVEKTIDETGSASATQIALEHAKTGFVKSFSVVAEDYAEALATNPQAAYNIYETVKDLYKEGVFNGILNPLEDPSIDATKPLPNPRYRENCIDTNGKTYEAFEVYSKDATYAEMRSIKNRNKQRLFERFSAQDVTIITGDSARKANINPEAKDIYDGPAIKPELIDLIKQGKGDEVPLFVSWGRLDTQKGFDIAIDAFEKFAKTPEGKNAVFVIGAGLIDGNAESEKVQKKIKAMLQDPELQGRVVHIDGWAPAYALASAADAAVFTSRFEPCGLTDIEAMKYFCCPIVTNTQGFKQKNFDPRNPNEAQKATSFKTTHEFDLLKSQVQPIIDAYVNKDEAAKQKVQAEYPTFWTEQDGQKVYDDSAFVKFAEEYSEYIDAKKQELEQQSEDGNLPVGWNDWDNLSKNYAFKYTGFARDLKDAILSSETADAISAYANTDANTKDLMYKNLQALNTGWQGNKVLHPTNQSSYELYKERHMMPDYSKPKATDVIAKDDKFIMEKIESRQKDDMKDRVSSYVVGALTGLSALLFTKTKNKEYNAAGIEEQLKKQISSLEKKLVEQEQTLKGELSRIIKNNKKNMAIAGVLSAVGAAAVTFAVTRKLMQNKKAKTTNVAATPVQQKQEEKQIQQTKTASVSNISSSIFSDFGKVV